MLIYAAIFGHLKSAPIPPTLQLFADWGHGVNVIVVQYTCCDIAATAHMCGTVGVDVVQFHKATQNRRLVQKETNGGCVEGNRCEQGRDQIRPLNLSTDAKLFST